MILAAFDPGTITSFAIFDTERPWEIEIGEVRLIGAGRELRPCGLHIREIVTRIDQALIEKVGAMKNQGVSSMFTFGMSTGAVLGAISALGVPLERVEPREWKKGSRLSGLKDTEGKTAARLYAKELWPEHAATFDMTTKHGMADAALMARWYFLNGPGRHVPIQGATPMRLPGTQLLMAMESQKQS